MEEDKKVFIWCCGTSTDVQHMQAFFTNTISGEVKSEYIPGIGTEQMVEEANMLSGKTTIYESLAKLLSKKIQQGQNVMSGYYEKNQVVQAMHLAKMIEEKCFTNRNHLILGGHSRGAAAGILGLLSTLHAALDAEAKFSPLERGDAFSKIKNITLLVVDPVAGPYGNDLMGLEKFDKRTAILDLLTGIENMMGVTINIHYFAARFDARNDFCADTRWNGFINNPGKFKDRIKIYRAGFRHSAMVYKSDEITSLYPDNNAPTDLLLAIVKKEISGNSNVESIENIENVKHINSIEQTVRNVEVAAIQHLHALQELKKSTTTSAYDYGIILNGSSLETIVTVKKELKAIISNGRLLISKEEAESNKAKA